MLTTKVEMLACTLAHQPVVMLSAKVDVKTSLQSAKFHVRESACVTHGARSRLVESAWSLSPDASRVRVSALFARLEMFTK